MNGPMGIGISKIQQLSSQHLDADSRKNRRFKDEQVACLVVGCAHKFLPNPTKIYQILHIPSAPGGRAKSVGAARTWWLRPSQRVRKAQSSPPRVGLSHFWQTELRVLYGFVPCSDFWGLERSTHPYCPCDTAVNFSTLSGFFFPAWKRIMSTWPISWESPTTQFELHAYGSVAASAEFMVGNGKDSSGFRQVGRAKSFRKKSTTP